MTSTVQDIHPAASKMDPSQLQKRHEELKTEKPHTRARDAAKELGVSEAHLVAYKVGSGNTRLIDDPVTLLQALTPLGEVMALTRNDACVHERNGVYSGGNFSQAGKMIMGLFVNPDIDLRLFLHRWNFSFAVTEQGPKGPRKSLQFFDQSGDAVHKIYLTARSDEKAYDELVKAHQHSDQSNTIQTVAQPPKPVELSDDEIDWPALREAWKDLQDIHDFHPMLRKFKAGREQALRHVGEDFAYQVSNQSARQVLDMASENGCEIMVFVGNSGCVQIHTGQVHKLMEKAPWYNVLDERFSLHLRETDIARTWITKKPIKGGYLTSVECFNDKEETIITFFGKRRADTPEQDKWREMVAKLPAASKA